MTNEQAHKIKIADAAIREHQTHAALLEAERLGQREQTRICRTEHHVAQRALTALIEEAQ